ncbi:AAA family ATPase [Microbacterium sp. NPDC089320]|uniref:MinD/ParA family ATP-binding protein n=1 Tax=Microbacterium sp. NPDC089320 TaxID=3155182 RepID=UPI00341E3809
MPISPPPAAPAVPATVPAAAPAVPPAAPAVPAAAPVVPAPAPSDTPVASGSPVSWSEPQSSGPHGPARPSAPPSTAPYASDSDLPPTPPLPAPAAAPSAPNAAAAESASSASSRRQEREQGVGRRSFLQEERREEPARQGARGLLNRVGFTVGPSARERAIRDDEHAVSRHWPGPRTVAVVNGKGGAGKTPATVLLSAVFAQYGGAGVLAWDNNQTRGTLGWRTETGAHDRTLLELLPQTQRLLGAQGQSADLAHFVHHQPQEKYDVLRSKPVRLAHENRLRPTDVDSIHAIAAKFYRLIIIDSGNDESDPMWLRMIDLADQIVVATTTRDDHAEAGALLLEALEDRDERSARLARESVVVVSQADPKASPAEVADVIEGYRPLAREVVGIPFDREMVDGHLRLRALATPTQRSWLSAAAAVARGF